MAVKEIGVTVKLDGERQYSQQMRQITQNTKLAAAETKKMESEWGNTTTGMQKAAQQTELLKNQIDRQRQSVEQARQNVEIYTEKTGENSAQTLKWKTVLAEAEAELNRLENQLEQMPSKLDLVGQKMQSSGQKIQKIGDGMAKAGKSLTKYVTAPVIGLGAIAVKTTADFDSSMSKVMALSGATGDEFETLRNKAREMGSTTKYSASESADALSYMALAGWDTEQMVSGLDGVLNLAAASGMDLATASDMVTDYLTAFGLEAKDSSKMADQLAYAQANSNTTTIQLGEAFGNSAAQMHTAGQSMETTTAILEAFANQGLKGSEAGTALSAMMRDITQKMENGKIMIGETAVQVVDANGNFRDMTDVLADVEAATEGMGSAEKSAALMTTFTARSVKGVSMALTEGSAEIKKYRDSLYTANGTAKSMAETMQDNLSGQLTILKSQLQELAISFGDILVPHIRKAVEWIQKQVDKFNSLDSATKEQIVKFAGLAAAIGPVLLIGGKLVSGIGSLVTAGGKVLSWIGQMLPGAGSLLAAIGPVGAAFGLAAGAGAALGFALKGLYEKYGSTSKIQDFNQYVLETAEAAGEARKKVEESTEALKNTSANAESIMKEAEAAAELTDRYAEELYDLAGKTERTAEEQRRMESIISILNSEYPGFTNAVMDSNGELKVGVKELKEYVAQLKESARVKALQSIIEEYAEKIAEATKRQIEAEHALADAESAANEAAGKRSDILNKQVSAADRVAEAEANLAEVRSRSDATAEELSAAEMELTEALAALENGYVNLDGEMVSVTDGLETMTDATNTSQQETDKLAKAVQDCTDEVESASQEQQSYIDEMNELIDSTDALVGSTDDATESTNEFVDAAGEAGDATGEYADDVEYAAEKIDESLEKIRDAYEQEAKSAHKSIMSQKDLWKELEQQEGTSAEKMIAGLASHEEALASWNRNASALMNDSRYQTDAAFRDMVNTVVQGGNDLAPELQVIYDLWQSGDSQLEEIIQHYGNVDDLAKQQGESLAEAKTVAENGIENYNNAMKTGLEEGQKDVAKQFKKPTIVEKALQTGFGFIKQTSSKLAKDAGKSMGESTGQGITSGKEKVTSATKTLQEQAGLGIANILGLAVKSVAAGLAVSTGISTGLIAGKTLVASAASGIKSSVQNGISGVSGLQSSAKTAGTNIGDQLVAGLKSADVSGTMTSISSSVRTGITLIDAKKTSAKTAGTNIGDQLVAGLNSKNSSVQSAGKVLGEALATGLGNAYGSAQGKAIYVMNGAVDRLKKYEGSQEPYTWGRHLGDNFANGVGSAYGNAVHQAQRIADAVARILKHSTPKEGPLKDDDKWGIHLAENFANGMKAATPDVERAALGIANAAAVIPTATMLDIDAVSGRNVAGEAVTSFDIMDAFIAAAERIDWKVMIGNREFGRIMREQGAIA